MEKSHRSIQNSKKAVIPLKYSIVLCLEGQLFIVSGTRQSANLLTRLLLYPCARHLSFLLRDCSHTSLSECERVCSQASG